MSIEKMALVGTGVMGMGIAQIAAQAGLEVRLFDVQQGAAQAGLDKLKKTLEKLVAKGKITQADYDNTIARFVVLDNIEQIAGVDLVVEAIIENLEIKQKLFKQLEQIVSEQTILVSNTSSLVVTEIAASCQHKSRIAGFHFFNPVPLMKIVEVVKGLFTSDEVVDELLKLAERMGHFGVKTKDTPGFLVNHAGRAFGTESLKILGEGVATVSEMDRILREAAGFKMGPFELYDLTGLDVSHRVMESIFNQYYQEDRYRPNTLTRLMLSANTVGKKVGEGFYKYDQDTRLNQEPPQLVPQVSEFKPVWIAADYESDAEILKQYVLSQGVVLDNAETPAADSLIILATYGEDTTTASQRLNVDAKRAVNIDMLTDFNKHRVLMPSIVTEQVYVDQAHALFAANDHGVSVIEESVGFVCQRVVPMIINLACDIAQQGIATASDIDKAVRLGLGYPYGPITWGNVLGPDRILLILDRIYAITGDQRYRPSPWLQRRAKLKVDLLHSVNKVSA
ncbi:3-hydroxyacyl-CoA dehydrogenase (plasmid) [Acinetobacter sp. LoGeW2-3]|uniref:3-hydroxyacyl-CoA dehydrogenase n=1 Tax=Acinetobacter sp. LoGeW2-3 TaxID=1808001 RepID=UPI000C05CCC8|nr:3-hydroxyacyl-CoA dehydrogenase [Acinetobacter sp. LoGeW2-3]ATO21149.1 3-hydroxyacyl-CoA dehydrogenase [Acinetobacter sp. LoGeW2-3]